MSEVDQLEILDLRKKLPRAPWRIGLRGIDETEGLTLHYNGPPVADRSLAGELVQLQIDAQWHMRPGVLSPGGADGIQYEWAVLADGTICRLRDPRSILWHCANRHGNRVSIPIHMPLGGNQDATDAQWAAFTRLAEALIDDYGLDGRHVVKGHREWARDDGLAQSLCPGPLLAKRLRVWRDGKLSQRFRIAVDVANIRQGPGTSYPVALGGTAKMRRGQWFIADGIVPGEVVAGNRNWAHLVTGVGFISAAIIEPF